MKNITVHASREGAFIGLLADMRTVIVGGYIYGIRKGDQRLATLELKRHGGRFEIKQIRGVANSNPGKEVEKIAYSWLRGAISSRLAI